MPTSAATSQPRAIARSIGVVVCITIGLILLTIGALTGWLRTQVLDTETWTETSRATLQQPEVQEAVSTWMVDQVYDRLEPEELLGDALPPRLDVLAGPISSRLRVEAYEVADKVVASPKAEEIWVNTNRRAHERFVRAVHGDAPILVDTRTGIVLDLRPLLEKVADAIGINPELVNRIPEHVTSVRPEHSEELDRALTVLKALDKWGAWLSVFAIPFLLLGVWLSRNRRRAWFAIGAGTVVSAYLIGQTREWLGPQVAEMLTSATTLRPAVLATWNEVTMQLIDVSAAGMIIGFGTMLLVVLTGPYAVLRRFRVWAAPVLVDHRAAVTAASFVAGWLLVNSIDVLDSRRLWVRLFLSVGIAGAAWATCRTAKIEADAADVAMPADAQAVAP